MLINIKQQNYRRLQIAFNIILYCVNNQQNKGVFSKNIVCCQSQLEMLNQQCNYLIISNDYVLL